MATRQAFMGRIGSINQNLTRYCSPIVSGLSAGWAASESQQVWGLAGTFSNLRVTLSAAPGAGQSSTFTIRKNGVDTGLAVTISNTDTTGVSLTQLSIAQDDTISLKAVTGASAASCTPFWSLEFVGSGGNGLSCYGFTGAIRNSASDRAALLGGYAWLSTTLGSQVSVVAAAGTVTRAKYLLTAAPNTGKSYVWTIYKNGTAQDGSGGTPDTRVTISDAATAGAATFSLTCAAGDRLEVRSVPSGTPDSATCSCAFNFTATTDGDFNICMGSPDDAADANFQDIFGTPQLWGATESARHLYTPYTRMRVSDWYVFSTATVTSGNFIVRRNSGNTSISAAFSGGTTGNDTSNQQNFDATDTIDSTFSGTISANRLIATGLKGHIKEAGGGGAKSNGGKKGGGGISLIPTGGTTLIQLGNSGIDIGINN